MELPDILSHVRNRIGIVKMLIGSASWSKLWQVYRIIYGSPTDTIQYELLNSNRHASFLLYFLKCKCMDAIHRIFFMLCVQYKLLNISHRIRVWSDNYSYSKESYWKHAEVTLHCVFQFLQRVKKVKFKNWAVLYMLELG